MTVLYLTHDGITDHIGRSQIAPYLLGLAGQGFRIHVLSAEKPGREELSAQYHAIFLAAGISWTTVRYSNRFSLFSFIGELVRLYRAAAEMIKNERIHILHCRCFPATIIGKYLIKKFSVKLVFDFRDFWPDTRLDTRRFKLPYRYIKSLEPDLVRCADKIVCLTARARSLLIDWYLTTEAVPQARFQVIPCCADFDHFDLSRVTAQDREKARRQAGLEPGRCVLLYLGSLGPDYLLDQMLTLFRQLLKLRPDACFLFVSNNGRELVEAGCREQGISFERIRFVSADRSEVPAYLALADLSVVFIRPSLSKAGCSPTKLAELFACNVPVIANTHVGDLDQIIDLEVNGSAVVSDFHEETLLAALQAVLARKAGPPLDIRSRSREFSLEEGVRRYTEVYRELLAHHPVQE
ncbi:glycosyl transferase [Geomonas limicola]|uniref:Glycosyl transferase n=1 Tax=Geomonas limicola TaxID=2740186 RepID=A0A6V8N8Z9_9BACT|nr:glycosyltransferase [Geomonas limicola]GFO69001.1 glycosyl transferase [Geomonas limicola]